MGMKFHKLYVTVLNPLGILLLALLAVVLLLGALNISSIGANTAGLITDAAEPVADDITELVNIPLVGDVEASDILWVLFGLAAAMFLFMLLTELLLVARKRSGIVMLSLSLILGIVSNVVSFVRYQSQVPWYTMAISVVISALILSYYWLRYKSFG